MSPDLMPRKVSRPDPDVFVPRPWSKLRPEDRRRREELERNLEALQRKRALHLHNRRFSLVTDIDMKIHRVRELIFEGTQTAPLYGRFRARWDD